MAKRLPSPQSERELQLRAEALAGRTLGALAAALALPLPRDPRRSKGYIGGLVEAALGADPQAGSRPDFPHLGIELKTVPWRRATGRPVESTFVCSVGMATADTASWQTSILYRKLMKVLWVPIDAVKDAPLPERRFGQPRLWSPDAPTWDVLRTDWEMLMGAIACGSSQALSAYHGQVLQVRPKAAHAGIRTLAPGDDNAPIETLPLGFYLRANFTQKVLMGECGE